MRRKDREVKNLDGIKAIVSQCKVCRIALSDNEGLYIVPVNFGYKFDGEKLIIYIHSAKDGRKVTAMTSGCSVAVEMDCGHALVENTVPCKHGYRFSSVIGHGKASLVTDANEKINA